MKKNTEYATEAGLCAAFIAWAKKLKNPSWTPYAETAGWDILLVAPDGTQIGIQAKLKFNMKVLHQTIPGNWDACRDTGPDFRAILLPDHDGIVDDICGALGIVAFHPKHWNYTNSEHGFGPDPSLENRYGDDWHYWCPRTRHELPDFVPDVVAGDSGPVQLTKWKVAALRIVASLELRGYVTRSDFKRYGIDPRRWVGPSKWLVPSAEFVGEYTRGEALDFDKQHPGVYPQVLAEVRETIAVEGAQLRLRRQTQEVLA